MPYFLDTRGNTNLGIGICDRCRFKYPLVELGRDPNYPGLRVCKDCKDQYDPWRLPALQPERITLPFVRPDAPISDPSPLLSTQQVLSQRLVDQKGNAILDQNGQYIDVQVKPPPDEVPL